MGVSNSVPLWMNPNKTPPDYDAWGYLNAGQLVQPPQHDWSELYQEALPDTSNFTSSYLASKAPYNFNPNILWVGQQNDRLATWGMDASKLPPAKNSLVDKYVLYTETPQFAATGSSDANWSPDETTCNPSNFPNCDMTSFAASNDTLTQYNGWWKDIGMDAWPLAPTNVGKKIVPPELYQDTIQRMIDSYSRGDYVGLAGLNSKDTSDYDPCAGDSFLEKLLPLALGGVGLLVVRIYGAEVLAVLPDAAKGIVEGTIFFTLFYMGKGLVDAAKIFEDGGESATLDIAAASRTLVVGAGLTFGSVVAQETGTELWLSMLGGGALGNLFQPLLIRPLSAVVAAGGIASEIPMMLLHYISKWLCKLSNAGMNACDDFGSEAGGSDAGFPDARRWDVASLSARLTDIACEQESWSKDSPQAKFVFRSLLTNPAWMTAATTDGTSLWDGTVSLNPLGLIAPIEEHGTSRGSPYINPNQWGQAWTDTRYSFAGALSKKKPVESQNYFACQNFDLLYNASKCSKGGIDKNYPPCAIAAPDNKEDVALSNNMQNWLQDAIEAARIPGNLLQQHNIPGLGGTKNAPPPELPAVKDYLKEAHRDATSVPGIGFDTIKNRGDFALFYLNVSHPLATGVEETECIANSLFRLPSMEDAWTLVTAPQPTPANPKPMKWDMQDLIALAHFWYRDDDLEMGDNQRDKFNDWEGDFEIAKEFKKNHPFPKGFTADPWIHPLTDLPPVYPLTGLHYPLTKTMHPLTGLQDPLTNLTTPGDYLVGWHSAYLKSAAQGKNDAMLAYIGLAQTGSSWEDNTIPKDVDMWSVPDKIQANLLTAYSMQMWSYAWGSYGFWNNFLNQVNDPLYGLDKATWYKFLCQYANDEGNWFLHLSEANQTAWLKTYCV